MIPFAEDTARLSTEFSVVCDPAGVVLWADDRAQRRIRATPGDAVADLCVPGTTLKAQELTRRGSTGLLRKGGVEARP